MAAEKQTTVRLDEDLLKDVKRACIERGTNQTDAINTGLRLWLGAAPEASEFDGLSTSDRRLALRYVEHLKKQTDPVFLGIIRTMLDRMEANKP